MPNLSLIGKDNFRGEEGSITRVSAIDQRLRKEKLKLLRPKGDHLGYSAAADSDDYE